MKKRLLTALAISFCLSGFAQTKGTSALSFGVNSTKYENKFNSTTTSEMKINSYSFGYGYFIQDNQKLGFDLGYGYTKQTSGSESSEMKTFTTQVNFQQYYPIVKSLYAYAGGRGSFLTTNMKDGATNAANEIKGNGVSVGGYGGVTWFVSKRFAFETTLLSADASYSKTKTTQAGNNNFLSEGTEFSINSEGFIKDLGFKIYLLF